MSNSGGVYYGPHPFLLENTMSLSVAEILSDLPALISLVQKVEEAGKNVAAASDLVGKVRALEPVLEAVAALAEQVKSQASS